MPIQLESISVLRPLVKVASFAPEKVQVQAANLLLNTMFAQQLNDGELAFLEDKVVKFSISDLSIHRYVSLRHGKLNVLFAAQDDAAIVGELESFIALASQQVDPDTLFFRRKLTILGDTELGLQIKNLLDSLDIEELPSPVKQAIAVYNKFCNVPDKQRPA